MSRPPIRSNLRGREPHGGVVARKPPVVRPQEIAALGLGNVREVLLPRVREETDAPSW